MMKRLLCRFYHGFSVTMIVILAVHFIVAAKAGHAVTPGFAARFSCETEAVLVQLVLVGVIGMAFAGAATLFEIERWSYLKQGIVHFLVTAAVWMPIAWICWSPVNGLGLALTIIGWTLTYIVNWTVQSFLWKKKISEINRAMRLIREKGDAV